MRCSAIFAGCVSLAALSGIPAFAQQVPPPLAYV